MSGPFRMVGGLMDFEGIIAAAGVAVVTGELPAGWWGAYDWRAHRIVLRPRLGVVQYTSTLAHELGHAWHLHRGTTPRQEREANAWAVRHLITPSAFVEALQVCDYLPGVAQILGVMPYDVEAFISTLSPDEVRVVRGLVRREESA